MQALRTLRLLEEHHQKLHQILKYRSSHPTTHPAQDSPAESGVEREVTLQPAKAAISTAGQIRETSDRPSSPPHSGQHSVTHTPPRPAARDISTSIASNLASARGIPSPQRRRAGQGAPVLPSDQVGGRILNSLKRRDFTTVKPSTQEEFAAPPVHASSRTADISRQDEVDSGTSRKVSQADSQSLKITTTSTDEPFQRFYATFENLISKLSAPLAFAGLPLAGDEVPPAPQEAQKRERSRTHETATAEPDLNKLFSKSALRAVKDVYGPNSLGAGGESFYVVPTTGGTISYAGILSRAEQERLSGSSGRVGDGRDTLHEEEEPEFVDARETPQPPSPSRTRHGSLRTWRYGTKSHPPAGGASTKTLEELQIENQALKQLSDTLSRRLHMWEVNAQSSSMALQQSLRALQRSPAASDAGKTTGDVSSEKLKELEEELRVTKVELEKVGKENDKLKAVVGRYREKWEKLKEGARMRREGSKNDSPAKD